MLIPRTSLISIQEIALRRVITATLTFVSGCHGISYSGTLYRRLDVVATCVQLGCIWIQHMPLTQQSAAVMDLTSDAESPAAPSNPITEDGIGGREIIPAAPKKASRLREYIEKFDQTTLLEMSRMLSQESVAIVETQTSALFGDIRKLQEQMQNAVGQDISSYEELMTRVQVTICSTYQPVQAVPSGRLTGCLLLHIALVEAAAGCPPIRCPTTVVAVII